MRIATKLDGSIIRVLLLLDGRSRASPLMNLVVSLPVNTNANRRKPYIIRVKAANRSVVVTAVSLLPLIVNV